jgi:hypothetical protein
MAKRRGRAAARSSGRGGTVLLALAAGLAGGMLAPLLFPSAAREARPAAKSAAKRAMKAALALYERGREAVAEFGEVAGDILAEAQAEFADERRAKLAAAVGGVVALRASGPAAAGLQPPDLIRGTEQRNA